MIDTNRNSWFDLLGYGVAVIAVFTVTHFEHESAKGHFATAQSVWDSIVTLEYWGVGTIFSCVVVHHGFEIVKTRRVVSDTNHSAHLRNLIMPVLLTIIGSIAVLSVSSQLIRPVDGANVDSPGHPSPNH